MWQTGLATAVGAMTFANPVQAADAAPLSPLSDGGLWVALCITAFFAVGAIARRRREARVIC